MSSNSEAAEEATGMVEESDVSSAQEDPPDPLAQLSQELDAAKQEAAENYDKYLRAVAELENYKKRTLKERSDLIRYAGEHLARDLVDAVDDLERAVGQGEAGNAEDIAAGVRLIRDRFVALLERHAIKGEDAVGCLFDPAKYEAIASVPSDQHEPGTVVEQLRKAYMFKDKLLRAGQVVVAVQSENEE